METAMLERVLSTKTFLTAQGALDGIAARHTAIADNISNVNTPGYHRRIVPFEEALRSTVASSVSPVTGVPTGPAPKFVPPSMRESGDPTRADGSTVDIEREMADLAENTLRYQTLSQYVGGFFSGLKTVINSK
jgi:flagellar basal-body rod protein FlgB